MILQTDQKSIHLEIVSPIDPKLLIIVQCAPLRKIFKTVLGNQFSTEDANNLNDATPVSACFSP